ncbi:MAG: CheR family methyltransferase, partial [Armatimonadota bacterium]|nr:CheR family methyltransferase [Armatimonadota bacterium]
APLAAAHVVFCRNVFIYFARQEVERVLKCLWRYAVAPGYLVVGAAESLVRWADLYELKEIEGAFLYARRWEGCGA